MENGEDLFLSVIDRFAKGGVLSDIVLVGSWVLPIYRVYFRDAPEIPVLRTTDVDFLVGMPPRIEREFDVPAALYELGFEPQWSLQGDYCKYAHPDMEVEFLVPEPEAFVLLKLLVIPRRTDHAKLEKDALAARSVGEYLLAHDERRARLRDLLAGLPRGWQKTIRASARDHFTELLEL
ncbi:MAG: hypothetical protein ACLFO1_08390 [Spirochaetaceae bacterium]